jgi:rubrerythrin
MTETLEKALGAAAAAAREAELFYKDWAQRVEDESLRVLLGALGAAENEHWETLQHVTPADVVGRAFRAGADDELPAGVRRIAAGKRASLSDALAAAIDREAELGRLFEALGRLGGEAAELFRSLARDESAHADKLRASQGALAGGASGGDTPGAGAG